MLGSLGIGLLRGGPTMSQRTNGQRSEQHSRAIAESFFHTTAISWALAGSKTCWWPLIPYTPSLVSLIQYFFLFLPFFSLGFPIFLFFLYFFSLSPPYQLDANFPSSLTIFFLPPTQSVKHPLFSPATWFSKQTFIECLICVSGVWIQKWIKWKSKSCLCHAIVFLTMLFLPILRARRSKPHHFQSVSYSLLLITYSFQKMLIIQKKNRENMEEKKEASDRKKNRALNLHLPQESLLTCTLYFFY